MEENKLNVVVMDDNDLEKLLYMPNIGVQYNPDGIVKYKGSKFICQHICLPMRLILTNVNEKDLPSGIKVEIIKGEKK